MRSFKQERTVGSEGCKDRASGGSASIEPGQLLRVPIVGPVTFLVHHMRLTVPEPCHADWSTMAPRTSGRHCSQCDHVVADLTRATDAELMALFRDGSGPRCARFHVSQVDRILSSRSNRPTRVLPIAAFTVVRLALEQGVCAESATGFAQE